MRVLCHLSLVVVIACGDNDKPGERPDGTSGDGGPDAAMPVPCTYTEMNDATNDDFFGNGAAEATGLTFSGASIGFCGKIDPANFQQNAMLVDLDAYTINVPAQTDGLLYVTAPGAENLNAVLIEIYAVTGSGGDSVGKFEGTFASAALSLPPGDYHIHIAGFHGNAPAAPIDYKLALVLDHPTTRCPHLSTSPTYTEAIDGTTATGNDVYEVRYGMTMQRRQFTADANDMPEPTSITVAPGMTYLIKGSSDKPTVTPADWADAYQDRDTYEIAVDANTNQLSLRLDWSATTADLDYLVFPALGINDFVAQFYNTPEEFQTFAVTPGQTFWVMVAADDQTTGQPIPYDLSVCGAHFAPP